MNMASNAPILKTAIAKLTSSDRRRELYASRHAAPNQPIASMMMFAFARSSYVCAPGSFTSKRLTASTKALDTGADSSIQWMA